MTRVVKEDVERHTENMKGDVEKKIQRRIRYWKRDWKSKRLRSRYRK